MECATDKAPMSLTTMRDRHQIRVLIAIGVVALVVLAFCALSEFRDVRWYALHSYVLSVCNAVEHYHKDNGHYPQSLDQIDNSMLDYDLRIPLKDLNYEVTGTGYRVSYQPWYGRIVSCP
jgi:hypothetical protein